MFNIHFPQLLLASSVRSAPDTWWRGGSHSIQSRHGHSCLGTCSCRHYMTCRLAVVRGAPPPADHSVLSLVNFHNGFYYFTQHLLALEAASPPRQNVLNNGSLVLSLRPQAWRRAVHSLVDRAYADFFMKGITEGGVGEGTHLQWCQGKPQVGRR